MENGLDEVRKQITGLRKEMGALETQMRSQAVRGQDCGNVAGRLLEMRKHMVRLIGERNALGGAEVPLPYAERFLTTAGRPPSSDR